MQWEDLIQYCLDLKSRQLGAYPTPGRAWFSKSLFLGSKLPRGPGKPFQQVGGFAHHLLEGFPGPLRGSLPQKYKIYKNHTRPGVGYVPSCLDYAVEFSRLAEYGRRSGEGSGPARLPPGYITENADSKCKATKHNLPYVTQ
jgi:hypothetical protein